MSHLPFKPFNGVSFSFNIKSEIQKRWKSGSMRGCDTNLEPSPCHFSPPYLYLFSSPPFSSRSSPLPSFISQSFSLGSSHNLECPLTFHLSPDCFAGTCFLTSKAYQPSLFSWPLLLSPAVVRVVAIISVICVH